MRMMIFDKAIFIKDFGCSYGSMLPPRHISPSVNLFVKVTDGCNARCSFCSNGECNHTYGDFNHDKLWRVVDELFDKGISVNRINVTGGEPATVPSIVNGILERASTDNYKGIHLHLNTNGILLSSKTLMRHPRWNSISVSLHHYDCSILSEIYRVKISDKTISFDGVNMNIVNASCNLMRGYIDCDIEVEKMLKFTIGLGIPRLGFVSLMKVNNYCKKHYVDFEEINFNSIPHLYFTESRNRGAECKCSNYLYNYNGKILEIYMRNYANPTYCESSLMFDGQFLRQGFHDDNIIY